jgi:PAS domain S-box-containing protein
MKALATGLRPRHASSAGAAEKWNSFDGISQGCYFIDFDWRYLYVNEAAARQGGRTRDDVLGRTVTDVCPTIAQRAVLARLKDCLENRVPQQLKCRLSLLGGQSGWFEISMFPVSDGRSP